MDYKQFRNQQLKFKSSDGNINFIDQGEGEVIVLLHGVPTSAWLYRKMIPILAQTYRVIAPDMLGFGSSDSPKGYEIYNQEQHAKRLLELMAFLNVNSWHHVFHDAGGLWTWELLKLAPQKVKTLNILNTIIYENGFNPPLRFSKGFFTKLIMALYTNGITANLMLKGLLKTGLINPKIMSKKDIEGYKTPLLEGKTKAMYYFFTRTCHKLPNYSNTIKQLSMPKLVVWGKKDSFLVFEKMEEQVVSDLKLNKNNLHLIDAKHFIKEEPTRGNF